MTKITVDDVEQFISEHGSTLAKGLEDLRDELRRGTIEKRRHDVMLRVLDNIDYSDGIGSCAAAAKQMADLLYPLPPTAAAAPAKAVPDAG